jgi:hypothetical protein
LHDLPNATPSGAQIIRTHFPPQLADEVMGRQNHQSHRNEPHGHRFPLLFAFL